MIIIALDHTIEAEKLSCIERHKWQGADAGEPEAYVAITLINGACETVYNGSETEVNRLYYWLQQLITNPPLNRASPQCLIDINKFIENSPDAFLHLPEIKKE